MHLLRVLQVNYSKLQSARAYGADLEAHIKGTILCHVLEAHVCLQVQRIHSRVMAQVLAR